MSLVVAQSLSKTYATNNVEVKALQEVTFDIEAGSFLAFVGPSGSGKTTLLNLIGCLGHGEGSMGDFWVSMWLEGRPVLVLDHLKGAGIRA